MLDAAKAEVITLDGMLAKQMAEAQSLKALGLI
jgi:hypothetical protein